MIAAVVSCIALSRGGLPAWAGGRPEGVDSRNDWKIYLATAISIPIFALLVSGFSPFSQPPAGAVVQSKDELLKDRIDFLKKFNVDTATITQVETTGIEVEPKLRGEPYQLIDRDTITKVKSSGGIAATIAGIFLEEVSKPAGLVLTILGVLAFGYLIVETLKLNKIQRHRMQDLAVQRTGVLKDAGAARRL